MTYGILRCLDAETGEVMWEKDLETNSISLMAASGKLIILDEDGILRITEATPTSYREISSADVLEGGRQYEMFWTPPVLCSGRIYCRDWFNGLLICIDVGN